MYAMHRRIIEIIGVADFNKKVLGSDELKVVRFCAEWSGPCQIMGPIYEEMFNLYQTSASFFNIDIDKVPLLKKNLGVTELPTILFFKNGVIVDYIMGLISRVSLIEKLENAISNN